MTKFLLILALSCLLVSTQASYAAVVCNKGDNSGVDSNCIACPTQGPGSCTACNPGYFISSGTCTACATNCMTCSDATIAKCTVANAGYGLIGSVGAYTAISQCATNCNACTGTTVALCTTANNGFGLVGSVGAYTSITACAANCKVCVTDNTVANCQTANTGYSLQGSVGAYTAITQCATNCKACTGTTVALCTTPNNGYYLVGSVGAYTAISACANPTGCNVCNDGTAATCTTAASSYWISPSSPGTATACGDTFQCTACSATDVCTACTKGTKDTNGICCGAVNCLTCATPVGANAVASANLACAATVSGGVTTVACNNAFADTQSPAVCCLVKNCGTCNPTGATCNICASGYSLDSQSTPQCGKVANCAQHNTDLVHCVSCKPGYAINSDNTGCVACPDPNCATCPFTTVGTTSVQVCTTCKQTTAAGYGLTTSGSSADNYCVACADTNCNTCSSNPNSCSVCNDGYGPSGSPSVCTACTVAGCATCPSGPAVCASAAPGYFFTSSTVQTPCGVANCIHCSTSAAACDTTSPTGSTVQGGCASGYNLVSGKCVTQTVSPQTDSPSSASFNVSMTTVFTNTDTSYAGLPSSSKIIYGPGTDDTTAYVWGISTAASTISVIRRTLNATYGSGFTKVGNTTTDTTISTSISSSQFGGLVAVGPGILVFLSYAPLGDISVTVISTNGTTAITKGVTSNTDATVQLTPIQVWYDTGVVYVTYAKATHSAASSVTYATTTPTQTAPSADSWALNGIFIQAFNTTSQASIYNGTTGGVKLISLTQTGTIGIYGPCQTSANNGRGTCATITTPLTSGSQVYNFMVGGTNWTNSTTANYLWHDQSVSPYVIKTGTITLSSGVATSPVILTTDVLSTGVASTTTPTTNINFQIAGFLGSSSTSGAFITKVTTVNTGAITSSSNPTYTYAVQAYINGSTSPASVSNGTLGTPVSGYVGVAIQGYGVSDGFILVEQHKGSWAYPTPSLGFTNGLNPTLVNVERYFANGSANGAAVSLGTYGGYTGVTAQLPADIPFTYQDVNGSVFAGVTLHDTNNNQVSYSGALGKYLAQTLALGASSFTNIFAFLSLLLVALFMF